MNDVAGLLPLVLIGAVFWFLLIRPQRKRQLEVVRTQQGIAVGDEVMIGAGLVGLVAQLPEGDEFLVLELSPGVPVRVARGAVVRNLSADARAATPTEVISDEPGVDPLGDR